MPKIIKAADNDADNDAASWTKELQQLWRVHEKTVYRSHQGSLCYGTRLILYALLWQILSCWSSLSWQQQQQQQLGLF